MINKICAMINKILCSDYFFTDENGRYSSINVMIHSKILFTLLGLHSNIGIAVKVRDIFKHFSTTGIR